MSNMNYKRVKESSGQKLNKILTHILKTESVKIIASK